MVLYRSVAPWGRLLALCESGIQFGETEEILLPVSQIILSLSVTSSSGRAAANSGKKLWYLKIEVILNKEG